MSAFAHDLRLGALKAAYAGGSLTPRQLILASFAIPPRQSVLAFYANIALIPFLVGATVFSYYGLQRRKWQQGGTDE